MKSKYYFYMFFPPFFQSLLFYITKLFENKYYNVTTFFDSNMPYISFFVIFYVVWYLFLVFCPIIIYRYEKNKLKEYFVTYMVCSIISSIIFVFFPTTINRPSVDNNNFFNILVNFIYSNDTPALNCFPSLHALYSMLWILYIGFNKKVNRVYRLIISILCILIILSTLFIKQHAIVDLLGSLLVLILSVNVSKLIINNEV